MMRYFLIGVSAILLILFVYFVFFDSEKEAELVNNEIGSIHINYEKEATRLFDKFVKAVREKNFSILPTLCSEQVLHQIILTTQNVPFSVVSQFFKSENSDEITGEFICMTVNGIYMKDIVCFSKKPALKIRSINEGIR